jgi:hypothetical protein
MTVYLVELQVSNASHPRQFYLDTAHFCVLLVLVEKLSVKKQDISES